jgi:hypothetical protein
MLHALLALLTVGPSALWVHIVLHLLTVVPQFVLKQVARFCTESGPSIFPWLMEYLHLCARHLTKTTELEAICIVISHLLSEYWDSDCVEMAYLLRSWMHEVFSTTHRKVQRIVVSHLFTLFGMEPPSRMFDEELLFIFRDGILPFDVDVGPKELSLEYFHNVELPPFTLFHVIADCRVFEEAESVYLWYESDVKFPFDAMWKPLAPTPSKSFKVRVLQAVTFLKNAGMIFKIKTVENVTSGTTTILAKGTQLDVPAYQLFPTHGKHSGAVYEAIGINKGN